MPSLPRVRVGEKPSASKMNALYREQERASRVRVAGDLSARSGPGGQGIVDVSPLPIDAKIVGSGAVGSTTAYSWQAVYATADGGWADAPLAFSGKWNGTDPAYERNGNASVPTGTYVRLERDRSTGQLRFDMVAC